MNPSAITVQTIVSAPLEKVWESWNNPEHITHWAFASDDWEAPQATNDVKVGGKFSTRMQPKNGGEGFDFTGIYTKVIDQKVIEYDMEKAPSEEKPRHVKVEFEQVDGGTKITETFDPENENPIEMQRAGWQSILENFKKYVESSSLSSPT